MTAWWCEHAVLPGGPADDVLIVAGEDGRITTVAADCDAPPGATRLEGLTIPGLANAHSHAFHRALRGRVQTERGTFWTWREVMYRAAARLEPDGYHRLARAVYGEMVEAGMSVVGEFHYLHHRTDGTPYGGRNAMGEALLAAADDAGLRVTLLDALYLHGGIGAGGYLEPAGAQVRYTDGSVRSWIERVDRLDGTDRHRIGAALHSVRAVDPDSMRAVSEWAASRDAPIHAHVSEQVAETERCQDLHGVTPVGLLDAVGALGPRFTAVHATHLTEGDIAALADSSATVCLCPTTEQDLGDGVGPALELAAAGIDIALGSDSHATVDHLVEARTVEWQDRARLQQRGLHGAADLLRMATEAGHRSLGWDDAGVLAVGRRADLTTISLRSTRTAGAPPDQGIEAVVFAATAADVTSVVIDGRPVVADGRHRTIDVAAELDTAIEELLS